MQLIFLFVQVCPILSIPSILSDLCVCRLIDLSIRPPIHLAYLCYQIIYLFFLIYLIWLIYLFYLIYPIFQNYRIFLSFLI